jgi:hypothetical protein
MVADPFHPDLPGLSLSLSFTSLLVWIVVGAPVFKPEVPEQCYRSSF